MAKKSKTRANSGTILTRRTSWIGSREKMRRCEEIAQARVNARVAQLIYEARAEAGLTQRQLADLAGTKQPVIARLEDSDYEGHSLTMLNRIAEASPAG